MAGGLEEFMKRKVREAGLVEILGSHRVRIALRPGSVAAPLVRVPNV